MKEILERRVLEHLVGHPIMDTHNRLRPFDEWLDSVGAKRDALKFKSACDSLDSLRYCTFIGGRGCGKTELAKQLTREYYGIWETKEKERQTMENCNEVYTFRTKDFKGDRYEIVIDKSFKNNDYPYHVRLYSVNDVGVGACYIRTFGYRLWEQLETQFMYDLAANGIVVCTDCRDEITCELGRAKAGFGGRRSSYSIQGGRTTNSYANSKSTNEEASVHVYAPFELMPKIEKVIFNPPATIVQWKDGSKTVVKCQDGDEFDWEKGLAMAYVKRAFNNERTYYGLFKKNEPWMNLPNSSPLDPVHVHNSNVKYDPRVAKEVRIIVPKEYPVTGDIIDI